MFVNYRGQDGILGTLSDILDTIDYPKDDDHQEIPWLHYYYAMSLLRRDFDHSRFEQDFRRRWPDHWDEFRADVLTDLIMQSAHKNATAGISLILQNGVSPNRASSMLMVPLTYAIINAGHHNDESRKYFPRPYVKEFLLGPNSPEYSKGLNKPFKFLLCIVVLIMGGADVYYMLPRSFEWAKHWSELISHCQRAKSEGISNVWSIVLSWSGLDPDRIFLEDERRRKQAFRLRGATRSGVDEAILDPPPIDGLRCRKCRRRYCNNHDLSIFE